MNGCVFCAEDSLFVCVIYRKSGMFYVIEDDVVVFKEEYRNYLSRRMLNFILMVERLGAKKKERESYCRLLSIYPLI